MGKTGEVINVNGASMFEKQKKNETRIRSSHDVVSAMAALAPSRKRNVTIAGSWNPLAEHSASILDRLNTMHLFGNGIKSHENEMPPPYAPRIPRFAELPVYKGRGVNKRAEQYFRDHPGTMPAPGPYRGGKIGINILKTLGKAAESGIENGSHSPNVSNQRIGPAQRRRLQRQWVRNSFGWKTEQSNRAYEGRGAGTEYRARLGPSCFARNSRLVDSAHQRLGRKRPAPRRTLRRGISCLSLIHI